MEEIALTSVSVATWPAGSRARRVVAGLCALSSVIALVLSVVGDGQQGGAVPVIVVGVIAALSLNASTRRRVSEAEPGTYVHDADGARIRLAGEEVTFSRDAIARTFFQSPESLVIERKDGTLIRLGSPEASQLAAIAEDLGFSPPIVYQLLLLSPGDRSSSFVRVVCGAALPLFGMATLVLTLGNGLALARALGWRHLAPHFAIEWLISSLFTLAATVALVWFFRRKRVLVGTDGLSYGFVRRHYVPFTDVVGSDHNANGVQLFLRNGNSVELPVVFSGPDHAVWALSERIEKARASLGKNGVGAQNLARLDRRSRSIEEWLFALEALAEGVGTYRAAALSAEDLTRVVEDAAEPTERRVAAVLALRKASRPDLTLRVRIAAQTSLDQDTKIALEAAEEGRIEEEAIERATKKRSIVDDPPSTR